MLRAFSLVIQATELPQSLACLLVSVEDLVLEHGDWNFVFDFVAEQSEDVFGLKLSRLIQNIDFLLVTVILVFLFAAGEVLESELAYVHYLIEVKTATAATICVVATAVDHFEEQLDLIFVRFGTDDLHALEELVPYQVAFLPLVK